MASRIDFKMKPTPTELRRRLAARRKVLADYREPYAKAATFLDRWVQLNFRTEGSKVGGWEPFRFGGRWSSRGGVRFFDASAKLLQDTGRLRSSFTPFVTQRNAGIGSDLAYAKKHEEGIQGQLSARRMLPKEREVRSDVRGILDRHVKEHTGRRLFR